MSAEYPKAPDRITELLARYFAGELSPAEIVELRAHVPGAELAREALAFDVAPKVDEAWSTVQRRLQAGAVGSRIWAAVSRGDRAGHGGGAFRSQRWFVGTVAVLAIAALGAPYAPRFFGAFQQNADRRQLDTPKSMWTYSTTNGQRATITLPDGSTIMLNVASRLHVPAQYATGDRTVRLDGEAMFTIVHEGKTPFTVVTDQSVTRVLGTRFVVRHYAVDTSATIAVRDGKVAVHAKDAAATAVLTAEQQVTVGRHGVARVQAADPAQFDFVSGTLVLRGVTLEEAVAQWNRWYDADVRLADPTTAKRRITFEGAAGSVADLAVLLDLLFDDIGVVRRGRVLTLYPK